MDSVRFGRVLGIGARLAGRTLLEAVDAAAAPSPTQGAAGKKASSAETLLPRGREAAVRAGQQVRQTGRGVQHGGKQLGASVWRPFKKASGVLWLEVTGVFFGLIALFGLQGVWSYRAAWPSGAEVGAHRHLLLSSGLAAVFGYFCVSSFVRAARRGRKP